jgi:cytochrome c oxidase subunit 1
MSVRSWLFTTDHKRIALLYLASITLFFLAGGAFAALMRLELATPPGDVFTADTYNKLFTMHGLVMVLLFLAPSIPAVLGNYLIPAMIGARSLAFPRLNRASWYVFMLGGAVLLRAIATGGTDTGWTFYVPYSSAYSNTSVMAALIGVLLAGVSIFMTGLNFIVTINRLRAPELTWFQLPLFVWAHYAASLVMVAATPVLAVLVVAVGTGGVDPVLFQHLFWIWAQPVACAMVLPAMGVVSELIAANARRNIFGYRVVACATVGIAALSCLVWGRHMFASDQPVYASMVFSLLSFMTAIPLAVVVFHWIATLYRGSVSYSTPMLFAMGFIGLFTIGGSSGLFLAALATSVHVHGTCFEVAHFHYLIAGGVLMGYLGGIHHWWPMITGRLYPEGWGRFSALVIFAGVNLTFFPQFLLGYQGMPRRYHDYPEQFQVLNVMSSAGAVLLCAGCLLPLIYLIWSIRYGPRAGDRMQGFRFSLNQEE